MDDDLDKKDGENEGEEELKDIPNLGGDDDDLVEDDGLLEDELDDDPLLPKKGKKIGDDDMTEDESLDELADAEFEEEDSYDDVDHW